ncbi:MAG: GGDEF domain-containing protein [Candidatus Nitronauta litoralis]|uniref:diguanylate cyclase n=1 Tax=Candidatus Nitronauta litoralis TaxID=2705533 RepID=A0A7T0BUE1_9BACT|nr:MAG: GGDEF domain-containing protein [Candidatus Nitronauta litoralis]
MTGKSLQETFKLGENKKISPEYVERLSRILLAFCEGAHEMLPQDSDLAKKLDALTRVVEKTLEPQKHSGLAEGIFSFFEEKIAEDDFRGCEREGLLGIVRELTLSLKGIGEPVGTLDQSLDEFVSDIEKIESLEDLDKLKNKIKASAQQVRTQVKDLSQELESAQAMCSNLQEQLEKSQATSIMDSLTRVLNRSAYDMRVNQVVSEFNRFEEPCVMLVVDIDHFKQVNDEHGHQAGDKALTSIAHTIKLNLREADMVFRYGGEEFVVLLPKTGIEGARVIAEKIRSRVASIRTHLVNDIYADKEQRVEITVSVGLAELKKGDTSASWFERADKALYRAKKEGRNKVEVDD